MPDTHAVGEPAAPLRYYHVIFGNGRMSSSTGLVVAVRRLSEFSDCRSFAQLIVRATKGGSSSADRLDSGGMFTVNALVAQRWHSTPGLEQQLGLGAILGSKFTTCIFMSFQKQGFRFGYSRHG